LEFNFTDSINYKKLGQHLLLPGITNNVSLMMTMRIKKIAVTKEFKLRQKSSFTHGQSSVGRLMKMSLVNK